MSIRYEILEDNTIEVFYDDATAPSLRQPTWPNGEVWTNSDEASSWAELYIASINDEEAPYAPNARGEAGAPKPTAEQKAAIKAANEALDAATTPEERQIAQDALKAAYTNI